MADNMEDLMSNVKKMVDSGNIPPEIQQMMNSLQNSSNNSNSVSNNSDNNNNIDFNKVLSQVSPEMLNSFSSMLQSSNISNNNSSSNSSNNDNTSGFNIDMNTMLKMKNIISSMNQKDDPRANLLYSLKPYLRDSKKGKLDQYVNLLNMTKIADFMKNDNKENNNA
ncbi:MAG: hypothetical protein HFJ49_01010 [Clostridia bacterium]|nr:hypothetical protein [Clostridia bacterium]